jgi:hypothetical protein
MITHNDIGYNGRLGNQLFIYATLLAIKNKLGLEVGIPLQNCNISKDASYDMFHNRWVQSRCFLYDYFEVTIPQINTHLPVTYTETFPGYHADLFDITQGAISGYLQSWKYFDEYKDIIKKEFKIKEDKIKNVKDLLDGIKNKICIHIRLGDALAHPNIFKLNINYISDILSQFDDDEYNYIIFTDNFEYIKDWFPIDSRIHLMDYNEIESFYLMTQCDHFIISPSTYSWWAAYLAENKNTKVYSPSWWFNDGRNYNDLNLPYWNISKAIL